MVRLGLVFNINFWVRVMVRPGLKLDFRFIGGQILKLIFLSYISIVQHIYIVNI